MIEGKKFFESLWPETYANLNGLLNQPSRILSSETTYATPPGICEKSTNIPSPSWGRSGCISCVPSPISPVYLVCKQVRASSLTRRRACGIASTRRFACSSIHFTHNHRSSICSSLLTYSIIRQAFLDRGGHLARYASARPNTRSAR